MYNMLNNYQKSTFGSLDGIMKPDIAAAKRFGFLAQFLSKKELCYFQIF